MPRENIDYKKTKMYKIVCKDPNIKDIYVGHTTDFVRRKNDHKKICVNKKKNEGKRYDYYVYEFIRENGEWENWDMILIEEYPCDNSYQARARESELITELGATLNKQKPNRTIEEYRIDNKDKISEKNIKRLSNYRSIKKICECGVEYSLDHKSRHLKTNKHLNFINSNN